MGRNPRRSSAASSVERLDQTDIPAAPPGRFVSTESTTVQAASTFFSPAADYELLPYEIGDCLTDTSKREAVRTGGINENVGAEVVLVRVGDGAEWALDFSPASVRYSEIWSDVTASPWAFGEWYDLVSRDPDRGRSIWKAATPPSNQSMECHEIEHERRHGQAIGFECGEVKPRGNG